MLFIFHGDNIIDSRAAFNQFLDQHQDSEILRLDAKEINLDNVNLFLQSQSLFATPRTLALTNFFSSLPTLQKQLSKIINQSPDINIAIWQDKKLTATQISIFPKAKITLFQLDNKLYACLNAIRPKNLKNFIVLFHQVLPLGLLDLFLYMLKNNLRRQLTGYTSFNQEKLKSSYLQLIEIDFLNKSGRLSIPMDIAIERIMIPLLQ